MGLDIGDAVAESGDDGAGARVMVGAAAHVLDGDVDRLHRHALAPAKRVIKSAQGGELEQAGDRAAMEVARAADHRLAERHDELERAVLGAAFLDAEQAGIRRQRIHAFRLGAYRNDPQGMAGRAFCGNAGALAPACG